MKPQYQHPLLSYEHEALFLPIEAVLNSKKIRKARMSPVGPHGTLNPMLSFTMHFSEDEFKIANNINRLMGAAKFLFAVDAADQRVQEYEFALRRLLDDLGFGQEEAHYLRYRLGLDVGKSLIH